MPPDLALIIEQWDHLPEAVRAGIVAMVKASGKGGGRRLRRATTAAPRPAEPVRSSPVVLGADHSGYTPETSAIGSFRPLAILEEGKKAAKKQRPIAKRIFDWLRDEHGSVGW